MKTYKLFLLEGLIALSVAALFFIVDWRLQYSLKSAFQSAFEFLVCYIVITRCNYRQLKKASRVDKKKG